jgi:PKD repeat protein
MKPFYYLTFAMILSLLSLLGCLKEEEAPEPVASFTMDKTSAEVNDVVTFTNTSQNATEYEWNFGDGNTSDLENPTHSYANNGTFTIQLRATGDGGTDAATNSINITSPPAVAGFEVDDTTVFVNVTISFTNTSQNGENYSWDFGDGNTSTDENPEYSYTEIGTYDVELTVTGKGGDTQSLTKKIIVYNIEPGERIGEFILGEDVETLVDKITFGDVYQYTMPSGDDYWHMVYCDDVGIGFFLTTSSEEIYNSDIPRAMYAYDPFDCITDLGITIGSTLDEAEAAYGTPDDKTDDGSLYYTASLGIAFWSDDSEVMVEDIYITEPVASSRTSSKNYSQILIKDFLNKAKKEFLNPLDLRKH